MAPFCHQHHSANLCRHFWNHFTVKKSHFLNIATGNDGQPIRIIYPIFSNGTQSKVAYFDGDIKRPYLPSINSKVKDSYGRYAD